MARVHCNIVHGEDSGDFLYRCLHDDHYYISGSTHYCTVYIAAP